MGRTAKSPFHRTRLSLALAIVAGCSVASPAAADFAQTFAPHRAVYEISSPPDPSGEIVQTQGLLALEWQQDCEGLSFFQRSALQLFAADGGRLETDIQIGSWEATDASSFRFVMSIASHGEIDMEIDGTAARTDDGRIGVSYDKPDADSRILGPDVVFPWQFMRRVLEAADTGATSAWHTLLRGEDPEADPVRVRVQILGERSVDPDRVDAVEGDRDLLAGPGWRLASAYFEDMNDSQPTFELVETVLATGIVAAADVTYPDLVLRMRLKSIERAAKPDCS